jgi:Glycosyl hydrolase family 63 C-terminal domain
LLNFTWWVNRKDIEGNNLFSGGFLGLDNIGVFDRSKPLPTGGYLQQADGTAWMGFYCLTMLSIALELAEMNPVYEDMASKFFEHFVGITDAMNTLGGSGLWDEEDGFYYDQLKTPGGRQIPLKTRSLVGLLPLIAVEVLETAQIEKLPGFKKRMEWFLNYREDLKPTITYCEPCSHFCHRMLAAPTHDRLVRSLRYMLDENEFLSSYGLRSVSRVHRDKPYVFVAAHEEHRVDYVPGEGTSYLFGGNSNWRGPIWFPINYLIIEALERYYHFYGDKLKVECPVGSGKMLTLQEVAQELSRRLSSIFLPNENGERPCHGETKKYSADPHWRDFGFVPRILPRRNRLWSWRKPSDWLDGARCETAGERSRKPGSNRPHARSRQRRRIRHTRRDWRKTWATCRPCGACGLKFPAPILGFVQSLAS